jgi:two-component system, chemotaxis family, sensor kinase Cph1
MAYSVADLADCASEPIHQPGAIQPHGALLVCDEQLRILQASANCDRFFALAASGLLGRSIATVLGDSHANTLRRALADTRDERPLFIGRLPLPGGRCADATLHCHAGRVLLEFEFAEAPGTPDFGDLYRSGRSFLAAVRSASGVRALCELGVREVRRLSGFDRVLAYVFDEDGHGEVIAEDRADASVPSFLGQRFPAGDIPQQARELYRLNPLRLIPDASYTPCPLLPPLDPLSGAPTDMRHVGLRSVSPVHLQYMRNMGTAASMSLSILVRGQLWGLISAHHAHPRHLAFERRAACEHLAQILSLQIEAAEEYAQASHRLHLRQQLVRILAAIADDGRGVAQGLLAQPDAVLGFMHGSGVAIVEDGLCHVIGDTPPPHAVLRFAQWLGAPRDTPFHSAHLQQDYPDAESLGSGIGGALAVSISALHGHWVIWFRPEVTRVLRWAGRPDDHGEAMQAGAGRRVPGPRESFAEWREIVRGRSEPWRASEVDIANEFRNAILAIVMRSAEETAELAAALQRSNHELEAFSYSVSHDLRAPLRHIVGYSDLLRELKAAQLDGDGLRYVHHIGEAAVFAGQLVDNLLSFSQMGRAALKPTLFALGGLVQTVIADLQEEGTPSPVEWNVEPLPEVRADPAFLRLALRNLLGNAIKYSAARKPPRVRIWSEDAGEEVRVHVGDNGVGFNMKYVDKLFGIFQRLHRVEEFEGTGIGLANVKRIVERHGGRVWARGEPDAGATFSFSLPKPSTASV